MWNNVKNNKSLSRFFYDAEDVIECLRQQLAGIYDHCSDGSVFEQSFEIKDKNGVDIYEGDICSNGEELLIFDNYNDFIYTVFYSEDHSGLNGYTRKDLEVIGNIHEHKHLIK